MKKLLNQVYVIETKDGDFYQEEVEVYGGNNSTNTLLKLHRMYEKLKDLHTLKKLMILHTLMDLKF